MELRHLEHFLAVAEERHFTRAARRAHVVQSSLSASIATLERDLGASLFTRSTRQVELTDAGSALVPEARRTIAAAAAARAAVADVQGLERGSVAIGTGKALTIDLVPILTRFCEAHPNITLNLHQGGSLELVEAVRNGQLDFAPLGLPDRELPGVTVTVLATEPMVLACSPDHRLAKRQHVRLAELADEAFVDFDPEWGIRLVNDDWFAQAAFERRVEFTVNDMDMLLAIVAGGLGVAIVPRSATRRTTPVSVVSLGKAAPQWNVGTVVPADRPPSVAALRLLEMVQEAASADAL
jgi:DNA-binding transcriptional LysR family regulator